MFQNSDNFLKLYQNYAEPRLDAYLKLNGSLKWQVITSSESVPLNQWHLVCLVLNSATDTAYIYIDGSVKGRTKMGGGTLNSLGTIAYTALGNGYEVPTNYFQGKIDEVILYRTPVTPIVLAVDEAHSKLQNPGDFALYQNFPNPFNPSTTIRYSLPHKSAVQLTVFNTLGQQVSDLVNGEIEAGYHEVHFDGKGFSSGVYFYRLRTGDFVSTKRLLMVR